jgi:hypothetical protein
MRAVGRCAIWFLVLTGCASTPQPMEGGAATAPCGRGDYVAVEKGIDGIEGLSVDIVRSGEQTWKVAVTNTRELPALLLWNESSCSEAGRAGERLLARGVVDDDDEAPVQETSVPAHSITTVVFVAENVIGAKPPLAEKSSEPGRIELVFAVGGRKSTWRGVFWFGPRPIGQSPRMGGDSARSSRCCKVCSAGKPCGNSCISRSESCRQPPGCAC